MIARSGEKNDIRTSAVVKAQREYRRGTVVRSRYELRQKLGEGEMGIVWSAHSLTLDVPVALKLLHHSSQSSDAAQRLELSARAAAKLSHPGITQVLDFDYTEEGIPFLVMELLSGRTLLELMQEHGRFSRVDAVRMLLPIASALAFAHDRGVVHRDVKPQNVFVGKDDSERVVPKLLDFGIAQMEGAGPKVSPDVVGSPNYVAPEQLMKRGDLDHRADVWGFSVTLYELVSSRVPFEAKDYQGVVDAILHGEPTPLHKHGIRDDALWQIIKRGLSRHPALRFQNMNEYGATLARYLLERDVEEDISQTLIEGAWLTPKTGSSPEASLPKSSSVVTARDPEALEESRPRSDTEAAQRSAPTVQAQHRRRRQLTLKKRLLLLGLGLAVGLVVWALVSNRSESAKMGDAPRDQVADVVEPEALAGRETAEKVQPAKVHIEDLSPAETSESAPKKAQRNNPQRSKAQGKPRPASASPTKKPRDSDARDFGF
jgi:serine/threonine-protein kinase